MTQYTRPDSLPAWAEAGDVVQPSNAEIQTGWPASNVPPSRQRFNWILNWLANAVRYFLQLGVPEWSATETYIAGARVQHGGVTYKALASSTNVTPGTDAAKWEKWGFLDSEIQPRVDKVLNKSVAGGADVTLSATEADNGVLILTGLLTANINVIVPNASRRWVVFNNTTGSFSLTLKTATGSGVAIPQGKSVVPYCDGANNVRLAGSANDVSFVKHPFTASAGQTSFSMTYVPGTILLVTRNGADVGFTASNGSSIVLDVAASLNDIVKVYELASFNIANALTEAQADTLYARLAAKNVFTKGNVAAEQALPATTGTVTLDLALGNNFGGQLTGNITLANPSNMVAGQSGVIRIQNDGTTPRTIAYGSYWKAPGGSMPALTAVAGAVDIFGYYVESASRITLVQQADLK